MQIFIIFLFFLITWLVSTPFQCPSKKSNSKWRAERLDEQMAVAEPLPLSSTVQVAIIKPFIEWGILGREEMQPISLSIFFLLLGLDPQKEQLLYKGDIIFFQARRTVAHTFCSSIIYNTYYKSLPFVTVSYIFFCEILSKNKDQQIKNSFKKLVAKNVSKSSLLHV